MANTWQGEFPWQNLEAARQGAARPRSGLPSQRPQSLRRGGQRMGVDERLLRRAACRLCF